MQSPESKRGDRRLTGTAFRRLPCPGRWWVILAGMVVARPATAQEPDLAALVSAFWGAEPGEARALAAELVRHAGASFDDVYAVLRDGIRYSRDVPTGRVLETHVVDGVEHPYFFVVPDTYAPERAYPVRVYLHGGVARPPRAPDGGWWRQWQPLSGEQRIAVFPAAWNGSVWWTETQLHNLDRILDRLRRTYHVDDNRVVLFGVSDGASGLYYHAAKAATPWSAFVPLIGHPAVLNNPRLGVEGEVFLGNLTNRALFIANARDDRLYPVRSMEPFLDLFRNAGVEFEFHPEDGGHGVSWWPAVADTINAFLDRHVRDPLPDRLSWTTERTDGANRFAWVVIDRLVADRDPVNARGDPFPHAAPAGTVTLVRTGNAVEASTRGVATFTLLISPERFDLSKPITVRVNGEVVVDTLVTPRVETLLRWAARDLDHTMLFASEIVVTVPDP